MPLHSLSRRAFFALTAAAPIASAFARGKGLPVGLELFSVRDELKQDLMGTVRAVAKMGYDCVEFFSPYYAWTPDYARQVRKMMDDAGIRCLSTHNGPESFTPDGIAHAIELNGIIGSQFIVWASAGNPKTPDGWKAVAERLNQGAEKMKPAGLRAGYHNHQLEFTPIDGQRPMEVLAANTTKDVMRELRWAPFNGGGPRPVAWVQGNPGHRVGPGGLGAGQSRPYPFHALQRLVQGQGLQGFARRWRGALEETLRGRREDRRPGVLPGGAGRQRLSRIGNRRALSGEFPQAARIGAA